MNAAEDVAADHPPPAEGGWRSQVRGMLAQMEGLQVEEDRWRLCHAAVKALEKGLGATLPALSKVRRTPTWLRSVWCNPCTPECCLTTPPIMLARAAPRAVKGEQTPACEEPPHMMRA